MTLRIVGIELYDAPILSLRFKICFRWMMKSPNAKAAVEELSAEIRHK